MPYMPTVFRENGAPILECYTPGPDQRCITVKLCDADRHLCDADLMSMIIERLQDEEVTIDSGSISEVKSLQISFPVIDNSPHFQQWIDIAVDIAKSYRDAIVTGRIYIDQSYLFGWKPLKVASLPW